MGLDQMEPQAQQVLGGCGGDHGEATVTAWSDGTTSATPVGWTWGGGPVTGGAGSAALLTSRGRSGWMVSPG